MKYHIKEKEAFKVIGIEIQTTAKRADVEISELWHKFVAENIADKIPHKQHIYTIALYSDYGGAGMCCPMGPDSYAYLIGCKVTSLSDIPVGMTGKEVPHQKYAVFACEGDFPASLQKAWQAINTLSLERTFTYDIDSYKHFSDPDHHVDIFVGVK